MVEPSVADLPAIDRDVARGASLLKAWREALVRDADAVAGDAPLEPVRHVAGKRMYDALGSLSPKAADAPLRDALVAWVAALLLARIALDDDVAIARAEREAKGHFAGDPPSVVGYRQAWQSLVFARTAAEGRLWLDAAAQSAPLLSELRRARSAKRLEAVRRLGLSHPWQTIVAFDPSALRRCAALWLDATQDVSDALGKARAPEGGLVARVQAAVAREAGEGWPAHLTERWLRECFAGSAQGFVPVALGLPRVSGASSFARALYSFGFALREAAPSKGAPFALAFDPAARASHMVGYVFAMLAGDTEWQVRALGVGRRTANRQSRILGWSFLLHARMLAARLLLGDEADVSPSDRFGELGFRLFGTPLDSRLRGAFPAAADDEAARFVAMLQSWDMAEELRARFDVDWFRNPRAWVHLRAVSSMASREPVSAEWLDAAARRLSHVCEEVAG